MRQPGELEGVAEPLSLADPDFLFEHEVEELQIPQLRGLGPVSEGLGVLGEVSQGEPLGVSADPVGHQGVAHAAPPTPVRPAAWS